MNEHLEKLKLFKTIKDIEAHRHEFYDYFRILSPGKDMVKEENYSFIQLGINDLFYNIKKCIKQFEVINNRKPKTFIDLGCGLANTLFIAERYGLDTYGVELVSEYIEIANKIVPNAILTQSDLFDWKPELDYDIIYLYNPIKDDTKMEKLMEHLLENVPIGQIIIAILLKESEAVNKRCEVLSGPIVRKIK